MGRRTGMPTGRPPKERFAIAAQKVANVIPGDILKMQPLDVMLRAMWISTQNEDWTAAASFAREAAPYIHARLSSTESKIKADVEMTDKAVDRPPPENREAWLARRRTELGSQSLLLVPAAGTAD